MNKTAIKNFAIRARNKLIADISYRAGLMGINEEGIKNALSQSTGTTEFYDIGMSEPYSISEDAVKQRRHLVELIRAKERETNYKTAYKYVLEEVAYTWFNRLIAVRFMEVNDYLPSHIRVLSSDSGKMEPDLVTTPFDAELSFTRDEEQLVYQLKQENKIDELFRILFIKQCNALNEILPALFEKTSDYTELLLNLSVIDQDGVVYHLIHDIPEEDFDVERGGQVEIIGWLYQYYNSEPKGETFSLLKRNIKITADRIPSATQLFTPDWIVRYMVENSVGRLWIEHLKALNETADEADLAAGFGWKYYLPEAKQEVEVEAKLREIRRERVSLTPEQITLIDPCMGSGHILVYAFDVLIQIYENAGYGQRDAAKSILQNNLYGLDIDDRAFQMAYFAVMMKARQYNRRILSGEYKPNVYSVQQSKGISDAALDDMGEKLSIAERQEALKEIRSLIAEYENAKEYGSILTVTKHEWDLLRRFAVSDTNLGQLALDINDTEHAVDKLQHIIDTSEMLSSEFDVVVTNPPYLGSGNMNAELLSFVKKNYPRTKADLSTVFMERGLNLCKENGFVSMINIPAWMFLSSFESLREYLVSNTFICNMLHFGRGVFGADFGTTAFVIQKLYLPDYLGSFRRLFDKPSYVDDIAIKEKWFFDGKGIFYSKMDSYKQIPGTPIAYWIGESIKTAFSGTLLGDYGKTRQGFATGDNDKFLYLWYEIPFKKIGFKEKNYEEFLNSEYEYAPCNKGGDYRKWYGNNYIVCRFNKEAFNILSNQGNHLPSKDYYFKKGLTWSALSIGTLSMRYAEEGFVFETKGSRFFANDEKDLAFILGLMNSSVAMEILKVLCPTVDFHEGPVSKVPVIVKDTELVDPLVYENIQLAKLDWDSYETSWGFSKHPLV